MIRGEIPNEIRDSWFARKTILVVLLYFTKEVQYQYNPDLERSFFKCI